MGRRWTIWQTGAEKTFLSMWIRPKRLLWILGGGGIPHHLSSSEELRSRWYRHSNTWGIHISSDLTWSTNTATNLKKAHRPLRRYFFRRLKQAGLSPAVLTSFYRCVVESTLTSSITVWYGSCSAAGKAALQRVANCSLPSLDNIYASRCWSYGSNIMRDPSHPA